MKRSLLSQSTIYDLGAIGFLLFITGWVLAFVGANKTPYYPPYLIFDYSFEWLLTLLGIGIIIMVVGAILLVVFFLKRQN